MARSSKASRVKGRRRRGPPNWLTILIALAIVGGIYWYQGPADAPWKNIKVRSTQKTSSDVSPADDPGDLTPDTEGAPTPDNDGGDASGTTGRSEAGDSGTGGETRSAEAPVNTTGKRAASTSPPNKPSPIVRGVKIRDLSGKVVYEGEVDLRDTLKRIDAGTRLSFPNDGVTFQNREKRLPKKSGDYYREWVHRTPELSGPGPQRVVTGSKGEAYYTPDHYATFRRIR